MKTSHTDNLFWWKEKSTDVGWKVLLFLISPFLGFLHSLRRMNTKSSYVVFFLFAVFFGLSIETSIDRDDFHSGDAAVYRYFFELGSSKSDVLTVFDDYKSFEKTGTRDIFVPVMVYLVRKVSRDYHLFFGALAVVMAFFMLKSFRFLTREEAFTNSVFGLLIAFFFIFRNGIFNINGCRFWTASWIAIYSVFQIFRNNKKIYVLLAMITPMIHAAYWFFIVILILVFLFGRFVSTWKVLFFVSFLASSIAVEVLRDVSAYLPPALQFLTERYLVGNIVWKTNLYQVISRIFSFAFRAFLVVIVCLFIKNEKTILSEQRTNKLYRFLLVWLTIVNFVLPVPSLGVRFLILSYPVFAYIWLVCFESRQMYRRVLCFLPIVGLMSIYERVVCYLTAVDFSFWYTSPIYQIIKLTLS